MRLPDVTKTWPIQTGSLALSGASSPAGRGGTSRPETSRINVVRPYASFCPRPWRWRTQC
eukprot:9390656-Heterocapsa_arctica.AAC.1